MIKNSTFESEKQNFSALSALTAAALALPGVTVADTPVDHLQIDASASRYEENQKRYDIHLYQALFKIPVSNRFDLRLDLTRDVMTGASMRSNYPKNDYDALLVWFRGGSLPASFTGAGPAVESRSGATIFEARSEANLKGTYYRERSDFSLTGGISSEKDYNAVNIGGEGRWHFNQNNTTLAVGGSFSNDTLRPTPDVPGTALTRIERADKDSFHVLVGATQLLDNKSLIQSNLTGRVDKGYLADPYKGFYSVALANMFLIDERAAFYVVGVPSGAGIPGLFIEKRPRLRREVAWFTKYQRHFPGIHTTAHVGYRLYKDSWGVLAHTLEAQTFHELSHGFVFSPTIRYYRQNAARFYALVHGALDVTIIPNPLVPSFRYGRLNQNASSDPRLSKFGAFGFGFELTKTIKDRVKASVGYEHYRRNQHNKPGFVHGDDDFTAGRSYYPYKEFKYGMVTATVEIFL